MKDLLSDVRNAVASEYDRAATKFGATHNSRHEAYAILREEFEETEDSIKQLSDGITLFWERLKGDCPTEEYLEMLQDMKYQAEHAAGEFIQVAAMAHKAMLTEMADKREGLVEK